METGGEVWGVPPIRWGGCSTIFGQRGESTPEFEGPGVDGISDWEGKPGSWWSKSHGKKKKVSALGLGCEAEGPVGSILRGEKPFLRTKRKSQSSCNSLTKKLMTRSWIELFTCRIGGTLKVLGG